MRMNFGTLNKLVSRRLRGERGSGLIAVIGIAAVTAIVGVTVGSLTVNAMNYTNGNRSSVQARAAAEAGINVAVAGLQVTGDCSSKSATYSSGTEPAYNATIQYKTSGNWTSGCPTTAATQVRIESTGLADGEQHTIEAIYSWIPSTSTWNPSTGSIVSSGSSVYTYGASSGMNLNNVKLWTNVSGKTTDFVIRNGGARTCQSGTQINGNVTIQNGSLEVNACIILGNLKVGGYAAVNSGGAEVKGDVSASGIGTLYQNQYAAQVGAGAKVGGNILAKGPAYVDGAVKGNVSLSLGGILNLLSETTISPTARIEGSVTTAGTIKSWNSPCGGLWVLSNLLCGLTRDGVVKGVISTLNLGATAPAAPTVPDWTQFAYKASDWTSFGFTEVMWTGSCTIDNNPVNQTLIKQIMASTTPIVVNATGCSRLLFSSSAALQLKLNANVAFISKSFGLENMTIDSASTAEHQAWFIVPSSAAPPLIAICLDLNGRIDINSGVKVTARIAAMIYTPNCVENTATEWRGQFYAGSVNFGQNISIEYVPMGLPGVNLDTSTTTTVPPGGGTWTETPGGMGTLTSMRDLAG
jgi:cytoskeletal protein CcmA (bactofilin family)